MATDLSKRTIDAAKPLAKPYELRDSMVRGLILRVQPSGHKAWVVELARGQRRTLSQPYPVTTLNAARTQAMGMLSGAEPWDRPKAEKVVTLRAFLRDSYRPWVEAERKSGKATANRIESAFSDFLDKPVESRSTWVLDKWKRDRTRKLTGTISFPCEGKGWGRSESWRLWSPIDRSPLHARNFFPWVS